MVGDWKNYDPSKLGSVMDSGLKRMAINPEYKGDCVYSPDGLCPTLRAEASNCGAYIVVPVQEV